MLTIRKMAGGLIWLGLVFLLGATSFAEQVTITTYYPAPYGVYNELRAKKMGIGENWYNSASYPITGDTDLIVQGDVGIGIRNPAQKLHVAGNLRVDAAIVAPEGILRDDGGGWVRTYGNTGWYSQTHGGGWHMTGTTWIRSYGNKNIYHNTGIMRTDGTFQVGPSGNRFIVDIAGRVGIGINIPAQQLHVDGTTQMTGFKMPTGAASGRLLTSDVAGVGTWQAPPGPPTLDCITVQNAACPSGIEQTVCTVNCPAGYTVTGGGGSGLRCVGGTNGRSAIYNIALSPWTATGQFFCGVYCTYAGSTADISTCRAQCCRIIQ